MAETPDVPETADKIGAYPKDYDSSALPEKRLAAALRMMTVIASVEAFAIAALGFGYAALLPLQKVVPFVADVRDKNDVVMQLNPLTLQSPTADFVTERLLRDYVKARYEVVPSAMEQAMRWGANSTVQQMSSSDVYGKFQTPATADYNRLRAVNFARAVRVDSVRKLSDQLWQVEYMTSEGPDENVFSASVAPESKLWVSTFKVGYEPRNVKYEQRLVNPLGFTVYDVNDSRRD